MTDPNSNAEKCLQSPNTTEENSTSCDNNNSSSINPNASILSSENDRQPSENVNDAASKTKTLEEEASAAKKKLKKPKKKSDPTKGPSGNKESMETVSSINTGSSDIPVPIFCKKCLGRNIGKKGERSDAYVITCSKCGTHEVLLKPDGNGVVKINEPEGENLPQGDLQDAAMKSAKEKVFAGLKLKDNEYPKVDDLMASRIPLFAQRLQYCSRECADLYPLIITLRSLQLKKTSSTPQQRKTIENEIKSRLNFLEEGLQEIENFAARYFNDASDPPGQHSTGNAAAGKKKKCTSAPSSASAGATSAEPKDPTSQANSSSLFDSISPTAASSSAAVCSPPAEENTAASSKVTGGASAAAANLSNPAAATSSKTKPSLWYIEKVEQLNSRLEVMHAILAKYIMIQSAMIQDQAEEAIAKVQRNEAEGRESLRNFTQGMVDHCKSTAKESCQKIEAKRKQIKDKQRLLTEVGLLARHCRANGDEEGLRRIEELLRQINLEN